MKLDYDKHIDLHPDAEMRHPGISYYGGTIKRVRKYDQRFIVASFMPGMQLPLPGKHLTEEVCDKKHPCELIENNLAPYKYLELCEGIKSIMCERCGKLPSQLMLYCKEC